MNKKILALTIGLILTLGANGSETYMSVIDKYEKDGGFVSTPIAKLSALDIEEADQDIVVNVPITFSNGKPTNGSVDYEITHITTTDSDIVEASGSVMIGLGHSNTIPVTIKGDYTLENEETFRVTLSSPKLITIPSGSESYDYTITDNDTVPTVSVFNQSFKEGDVDIVIDVLVELSKPFDTSITVDFETEIDTATEIDFENTSGTLTFLAGESQKTFPVIVKGDLLDEFDEVFKVKISNPTSATIADGEADITIEDNDMPPTLKIEDTVFMEGDILESKELTVTLSKISEKDVSVDFTTTIGTADSDDFIEETGTVTILSGDLSGVANIQVNGDYTMEDNETLNVTLSNPKEATIDNGSALVTLDNDDTEYEFNTLPLYGKVEYQDKTDGFWKDVIANYGYERDIQFRYNPTEEDVLEVSQDILVGSFDTDPSTPDVIDGDHSIEEWGTNQGNTLIYEAEDATITTTVSHGVFVFNNLIGTEQDIGLGSSEFSYMSGDQLYYEIVYPMNYTIHFDGLFLNDVNVTASALGGCFDLGQGCETRVAIDAYDEDNNLISSQGGYRQSGLTIDNYYFTGQEKISKVVIYPVPTNVGGNNPNLKSGSVVLANVTISKSAFEVIDYKFTDIDDSVSTETINLNINEGNANTNVDLNKYLLGQ